MSKEQKQNKKGLEKIDSMIEKSFLPSFMKNRLIQAGSLVILIVIIILSAGSMSQDTASIPTYKVVKDDFLVSITESGELKAKRSLPIPSPRIRLRNLKIVYMIPEGTYVDSGDVILKFDPTEAMQNLKEAESQLDIANSEKRKLLANHKSAEAQMESNLESAKLSFELSKLNLEQMKFEAKAKQQEAELQHKKNQLSYDKTLQEYKSKKIIRESELSKMNLEIEQKRSEVQKSKRDLNALVVNAPSEGLIVYATNWANNRQKFAVGDQPWPGQVVMRLPDLSTMQSQTNVNEVDVSKVKAGQKVKVKLDAFQDSLFTGEITSVAKLGKIKDSESNIKVFEVLVTIDGTSEILRPGMTTSNQIIINEIPEKVFVPHEAVFNVNDKKMVYIKNGSGFDELEVKVGSKSEDFIVIEEGIETGNLVALRNPNADTENLDNEKSGVSIPNSGS